MITGDEFQRPSFKLTFKLKFKSVRGRLFTFYIFEKKKRIAGSGSYEDFSIGAGAAATFYSEPEPEPEPEYFPGAGAGAGADQKCHGSASLQF